MSHSAKTVEEYLRELRQNKKEKPAQVRQALEIYIGMWEDAIRDKTIDPDENIETALVKLDARGGLHKAAESRT